MSVYGLGDPHIGMQAWGAETGQDFDLKIAKRNTTAVVQRLVASAAPSAIGLLVLIGDNFHADDDRQVTPGHGHKVDVDTRAAKVFRVGCQLWLSMILHLDAAITMGVVFYLMSTILTTAISFLYHYQEAGLGALGRGLLVVMNYALPQLTLFDLSEKVVHSEAWQPLRPGVIGQLTVYGGAFALMYLAFGIYCFRRRAL